MFLWFVGKNKYYLFNKIFITRGEFPLLRGAPGGPAGVAFLGFLVEQ